MAKIRLLSKIEQIALHLREEISAGKWAMEVPGREEIALEYGLNSKTVEESLRLLEREGVLVSQGAGKRRRISEDVVSEAKTLKIRIILYDKLDRFDTYQVELTHRLTEAGYDVAHTEKTLHDMHMDPSQLADYVKSHPADAWIVPGATQSILNWFVSESIPALAIFGRFEEMPIAGIGVKKIPAMEQAVEKLIQLGHRRIVLLVREEKRKPNIGMFEQAFLDVLKRNQIPVGEYNLPEWEDTVAGYHRCLDSLFRTTPPTALVISEFYLFVAAQQHLASMKLSAPHDVSLLCDDPHQAFSWTMPEVSHMYWDYRPIVSRALQWADRISRGKEDVRQSYIRAEFIEGGTIGPAQTRK